MRRSRSTLRRADAGYIVAAFLLIFLHRRYRENGQLYPGGHRPAPVSDRESVS